MDDDDNLVFKCVFNPFEFIKEVKPHTCLWLCSDPQYSDKEYKQETWEKIAEKIFKGSPPEVINKSMVEKVAICQKKWKYARDYYVREKKRMKQGQRLSKKKLSYLKHLKFLEANPQKQVLTTRNESSKNLQACMKIESDNDDVEEMQSIEELDFDDDSQYFQDLEDSSDANQEQMICINVEETAQKTTDVVDPVSVVNDEQKVDKSVDESNRSFLMSFVREMSTMNDQQNFQFRMEVMKAINKVKYQMKEYSNL